MPLPRRTATTLFAALVMGMSGAAWGDPRASDELSLERPYAIVQHAADVGTDVVIYALGLLGVPYHWGGDVVAHGFDCSGLVRRVFADILNLDLPHRSDLIYRAGRPVARDELEAGDLVFFNTMRQPFSHVAIYIGDGRFVHAPGRGSQVRIDELDEPYWRKRFSGARRLIEAGATAAVADTFVAHDAQGAGQVTDLCSASPSACRQSRSAAE